MYEYSELTIAELLEMYSVEYIVSISKTMQESLHEDDGCMVLYNISSKVLSLVDSNAACEAEDIVLHYFTKYMDLSLLTKQIISENVRLHFLFS